MKRTALFLLVFIMSVIVGAQSAPAPQTVPEGLAFETVGGRSVTITKYSGNAATVHIPERIQDLPVTEIGEDAFNGCTGLTEIIIGNNVTRVHTPLLSITL